MLALEKIQNAFDGEAERLALETEEDVVKIIKDLEDDMKEAASRLDFERAADLRNKLYDLKNLL